MQRARFEQFLSEIRADARLREVVLQFASYRYFRGHWHDDSDQIPDNQTIASLEYARNSRRPWRQRRSYSAFLPVPGLDAVLVGHFFTWPKRRTLERVTKQLAECLRHSNNEFDATHHALTGLLNQPEFEKRLRQLFVDTSKLSAPINEVSGTSAPAPDIHVLALDIDHFKQCNDSYGHQYGDLVLQVIGRRLESYVAKELAKHPSNPAALVSHPHGEEFVLVVAAALTRQEVLDIGERILQLVRQSEIPSASEWEDFSSIHADITLPHAADRRVTVSIGIFTASQLSGPISVNDPAVAEAVAQALHKADAALYRAKAGGRDTARYFADILQHHGTILEHRADTDVVVIDIGQSVGVVRGQEFLVFHPDFSGSRPYYFSDGRSKRKLGVYPRRHCGHIEVFDAQHEISFCNVLKSTNGSSFAAGSALEAIPLGSIAHLLSESLSTNRQFELATVDQLRTHVGQLVERGKSPAACVISLDNAATILKERGSAFANSALARLYTSLSATLPADSQIGQIDSTTLAASFLLDDRDVDSILRGAIDECSLAYGRKITFIAGAYDDRASRRGGKGDKSDLLAPRAIELALYAHNKGLASGPEITVFSPDVAVQLLQMARRRRSYDQALKDYKDFSDCGVKNAVVENIAGLCEFEREEGDPSSARQKFNEAIRLDSEPIYFANLALVECAMQAYAAANSSFEKACSVPDFVLPDIYKAARAYAAYRAYKAGAGAPDDHTMHNWLREAAKLETRLHVGLPDGAIAAALAEQLPRD